MNTPPSLPKKLSRSPYLCPFSSDDSKESSESAKQMGNLKNIALMMMEQEVVKTSIKVMEKAGLETMSNFAGEVMEPVNYAMMFDMLDVHGYGNMVNRDSLDSTCSYMYETNLCRYQTAATAAIEATTEADLSKLEDDVDAQANYVQNAYRSFTKEQRNKMIDDSQSLMFFQYTALPTPFCTPELMKAGYIEAEDGISPNSFQSGDPVAPCPSAYIKAYHDHVVKATSWLEAQNSAEEGDNDQKSSSADPAELTREIMQTMIDLSIESELRKATDQYKTAMFVVSVLSGLVLLAVVYFVFTKYNKKNS